MIKFIEVNLTITDRKSAKIQNNGEVLIGSGRVQWDPERDIFSSDSKKKEPNTFQRIRAIQIGLKGDLSKHFVENVISIEDVTELAKKVGEIHNDKNPETMKTKISALIEQGQILKENPYLPNCEKSDLIRLAMLPGNEATSVKTLGRGKVFQHNVKS